MGLPQRATPHATGPFECVIVIALAGSDLVAVRVSAAAGSANNP